MEERPGRQGESQCHNNQRRDHTALVAISQAILSIIFSGDQELIEELQEIHTTDSQTQSVQNYLTKQITASIAACPKLIRIWFCRSHPRDCDLIVFLSNQLFKLFISLREVLVQAGERTPLLRVSWYGEVSC